MIVTHTGNFSFDMAFCGDFDTLKYLFNHPEMQHRFKKSLQHTMKEDRMLDPQEDIHGVCIAPKGRIQIQVDITIRF